MFAPSLYLSPVTVAALDSVAKLTPLSDVASDADTALGTVLQSLTALRDSVPFDALVDDEIASLIFAAHTARDNFARVESALYSAARDAEGLPD